MGHDDTSSGPSKIKDQIVKHTDIAHKTSTYWPGQVIMHVAETSHPSPWSLFKQLTSKHGLERWASYCMLILHWGSILAGSAMALTRCDCVSRMPLPS